MRILAIDPGTKRTGMILWDSDDECVIDCNLFECFDDVFGYVCDSYCNFRHDILVVEGIQPLGQILGKDTIDTILFIGGLIREFPASVVYRSDIKMHFCHRMKGVGDANINSVLSSRFGGKGTKKFPGKLYGIRADIWSALAIAVYYQDTFGESALVFNNKIGAKHCILTYTGKWFDILNPRECDIDIEDIAHSLANICRYNGHTKTFYSVAEHCFRMARADLPGSVGWRFLHDSAEAYLSDVPSPLKPIVGGYKLLERNLEEKIACKFGVEIENIKTADYTLLSTEIRDLFGSYGNVLESLPAPLEDKIIPLDNVSAEKEFLKTARDIGII